MEAAKHLGLISHEHEKGDVIEIVGKMAAGLDLSEMKEKIEMENKEIERIKREIIEGKEQAEEEDPD